jgi:adenylate cyclase
VRAGLVLTLYQRGIMVDETTTIITLDLGQQVSRLSQLAEMIKEELERGGAEIPVRADQCLTQLYGSLNRLNKQVRRHDEVLRSMRALATIGQVVNSSLDLREVLEIVMDTIVRLTGAERGFLMLRDDKGQMITHIARNWEQESLDSSEFAISRTVINRVMSDGAPVITTNAQEDPRFGGQESIIAYNLRSILCVPFKVKGKITGVIYTDNRVRTGQFSDAELALILAFSDQAAAAIENARLFDSVRRTLAEVTELKNLMDNVFASIASGVITADIEDKILLCNRAAELILGRHSRDLLGHGLGEILPGIAQDLPGLVVEVRQSDRHIVGLEYQSSLPERGMVTLSFNLSPLKDASQTTQGVAIVLDDLTEKKRLEGQRRLFERMVSPAVIEQLDPDKLQLGGKRTGITTLFADIRGFTSFSENLDPETLVSVLNRYLAAAADAILSEQGTIDKFMGDAVMAWFNAPIPQADHALRAIRAALGIRKAVEQLKDDIPVELQRSFGVGIHYGEVVLGLVGTETRLEYTAIGDSVNTAKRIQENSQAGQILISAVVYKQLEQVLLVKPVTPIVAKGKRLPLEVYELIGLKAG